MFIAIPISEVELLSLRCQQLMSLPQLQSIRWLAPDNWHLTLFFMGNAPIDILPSLSHELHQVAHRHSIFSLELNKLGAFTSNKRPQILWCGVSNLDALMALQRNVNEVVVEHGFSMMSSFQPHITLARYSKSVVNVVDKVIDDGDGFGAQLVTHFSLYQSELTPQGSVYTILENYYLRGGMGDAP